MVTGINAATVITGDSWDLIIRYPPQQVLEVGVVLQLVQVLAPGAAHGVIIKAVGSMGAGGGIRLGNRGGLLPRVPMPKTQVVPQFMGKDPGIHLIPIKPGNGVAAGGFTNCAQTTPLPGIHVLKGHDKEVVVRRVMPGGNGQSACIIRHFEGTGSAAVGLVGGGRLG